MKTREDLERRVRELEQQLAQSRMGGYRGVRYASAFTVVGLPFIAVATGPDPDKGEIRGHAKGFIAIGDIATGVIALGGIARGLIAAGGLAIGGIAIGGAGIGALAAVGGLAIGGFALGGGAIGWTAVGGGAAGTYACGGAALGEHVASATHRDPEITAHFERYGLGALCPESRRSRRAH